VRNLAGDQHNASLVTPVILAGAHRTARTCILPTPRSLVFVLADAHDAAASPSLEPGEQTAAEEAHANDTVDNRDPNAAQLHLHTARSHITHSTLTCFSFS
jgi:hypothetical protein